MAFSTSESQCLQSKRRSANCFGVSTKLITVRNISIVMVSIIDLRKKKSKKMQKKKKDQIAVFTEVDNQYIYSM
jgi:hypothetical protein